MNLLEWISYKYYNFKNNIRYKKVDNNSKFNIGILLAAGTSSRFNNNKPKQLFQINNKSIISYSIESMINVVDELIIITNEQCYNEIKELVSVNNKIIILINDVNSRIESIKTGLVYINNKHISINKIIIHDSARPYVTEDHFKKILESNFQYSQYYLKLVNGLAKKDKTKYKIFLKYKIFDRDEYIEICTPVCCDYKLYYFIFMNYIGNKNLFTTEPLTILNLLNIPYDFVEAHHKYLRKITYLDDIY
jgi:2-C-methyl-D-erythritol 4-phosphate cytidylyltransferase